MDLDQAKRIIEGVLFASGEAMTLKRLKEILSELEPSQIRQLLDQLNTDYQQTDRAFRIQEVAGGYQLVTDPQLAPWLKRALDVPRDDVLSKAALETLAIIAYRQPISKAEIEAIRGVDGTATLETLLERQFVRVVGRKETPGRPLLYGTTAEFLRHFGLGSLKDLPPMDPTATSIPGLEPHSDAVRPLVPPAQPLPIPSPSVSVPVSSTDAAASVAAASESDEPPTT